LDVNYDGYISSIDYLYVANTLNALGPANLLTAPNPNSIAADINGDGILSSMDLLLLGAQLNAAGGSHPATTAFAPTIAPATADASADSQIAFALATDQALTELTSTSPVPLAAAVSSTPGSTSSTATNLSAGSTAVASNGSAMPAAA